MPFEYMKADPLIDYATTSFSINHKSCTGPRADKLSMHDRGSGIESTSKRIYDCFMEAG